MKALLTFCLASLLLAGARPGHAAPPLATANFSVERGLAFSLLLDDQPVAQLATQPVHLAEVAPGQHRVALSLAAAGPGRSRSGQRIQATVWLEEGLETSFVLTQRPGVGWQLRQVGTAALPGYGYEDQPGTYSQPPLNDPGYDEQPVAPTGPGSYPPVAGPGYPTGPGYPGGPAYPPAPGYPTGPAYPPAAGYPAPGGYLLLGARDAADLVRALNQYAFDDKRLPLFYQAIAHAYVRADDLAAMVHTMTFSESQQRAAEFGYAHLADPQNFHRVLAALTFPSDAGRVLDHLGLQRR